MTVHDEQVLLRLWAVAPPYRAAFRASLGVLLAAFTSSVKWFMEKNDYKDAATHFYNPHFDH